MIMIMSDDGRDLRGNGTSVILNTIIDTITIFVKFSLNVSCCTHTQKCASAKILCKELVTFRWYSFILFFGWLKSIYFGTQESTNICDSNDFCLFQKSKVNSSSAKAKRIELVNGIELNGWSQKPDVDNILTVLLSTRETRHSFDHLEPWILPVP